MLGADPAHTTAENYRWFARVELSEKSPLYAAFCEGVAEDPERLVAVLAAWLDARMSGCQNPRPAPASSTSRSDPSSPT